jgi:hypothetical protein
LRRPTIGNLLLDGEGELNSVVGELVVDGGKRLKLVLGLLGILLVDEDLEELSLVSADAGALADDLGGEDDVVEDRGVDGREGARAGALDALQVSNLGRAGQEA